MHTHTHTKSTHACVCVCACVCGTRIECTYVCNKPNLEKEKCQPYNTLRTKIRLKYVCLYVCIKPNLEEKNN